MNPPDPLPPDPHAAMRDVRIYRIDGPDAAPRIAEDHVVFEDTVTLMVQDVGSFTLMCTPTDVEALAVGFAFAEGMIDSASDVLSITPGKDDPTVVAMEVEDPACVTNRRNMIVATSCGLCGQRTLDALLARTEPCAQTIRMTRQNLLTVTERLRDMQELFRATGASHAAAIFDAQANMLAFGEDIGRHTALDKAIGKCLLALSDCRLPIADCRFDAENAHSTRKSPPVNRQPEIDHRRSDSRPLVGCVAALSGRASFEMVAKAARAGIEIVAAVSAPSSFAVDAAQRWGVTLCGFVRPPRANVYTHPQRIEGLVS